MAGKDNKSKRPATSSAQIVKTLTQRLQSPQLRASTSILHLISTQRATGPAASAHPATVHKAKMNLGESIPEEVTAEGRDDCRNDSTS